MTVYLKGKGGILDTHVEHVLSVYVTDGCIHMKLNTRFSGLVSGQAFPTDHYEIKKVEV